MADARCYWPLHLVPYTPASRLAKGRSDPGFRTKPQLAAELVAAARAAMIPFRVVVATTDPARLPKLTTWNLLCNLARPAGGRAQQAQLAEIAANYGLRNWVEGTVALSWNAPGKPSKVETLLHGRTPRRGRTTRPCL